MCEGCVVVMVRMMGIVVELCCAWGGLGCGGRKRGVVQMFVLRC